MKLTKTTPIQGNSNYNSFIFTHRVKGKKQNIVVRSSDEKTALPKAWAKVSEAYKKLKDGI